MMLNPCSPCCKTCCFTELVRPDRLPDKLYGQSLVDGKGDAFVLNKAIPGPSDPYGGATLYFGTFDIIPDGTPCFPDTRKGPVNIWISLSPGLDCAPYFVIQAPNYNPEFPGRRYGAAYMTDGNGRINGFYLSNPNTPDFYVQALYFTDTPTNADLSGVSFRLYRCQYVGFGGFFGTVTQGPLIFSGRVPLMRSNVGTAVGPGTPFPGLGDTKCNGKAIPGKSPMWLPAEFATRAQIASAGNMIVSPLPYGPFYDAVFPITGSGTLYDGWNIGIKTSWFYQGIGAFQIDLCSDCTFAPTQGGVATNFTSSGVFLTGQPGAAYNLIYPQTNYVTDQNITNPSMAFTFDLYPGVVGYYYGTPYPVVFSPPPPPLIPTSDCLRVEVAFGT